MGDPGSGTSANDITREVTVTFNRFLAVYTVIPGIHAAGRSLRAPVPAPTMLLPGTGTSNR